MGTEYMQEPSIADRLALQLQGVALWQAAMSEISEAKAFLGHHGRTLDHVVLGETGPEQGGLGIEQVLVSCTLHAGSAPEHDTRCSVQQSSAAGEQSLYGAGACTYGDLR